MIYGCHIKLGDPDCKYKPVIRVYTDRPHVNNQMKVFATFTCPYCSLRIQKSDGLGQGRDHGYLLCFTPEELSELTKDFIRQHDAKVEEGDHLRIKQATIVRPELEFKSSYEPLRYDK